MILKLIPRHHADYKQSIEYILKDGKGHNGTKPEAITHNLRGNTVDEWVKEYKQNETLRNHPRKDQIYFYHDVISFHKSDHQNITKEKLTDIAQEYIRQRGIQGIYAAAVHEDRANFHIHCITGGIELHTGKAFRLSQNKLKELKLNLQEYHQRKYPEITHSTVGHGQGKEYVTDREYQARQRVERALYKDQIKATVAACFAKSVSKTQLSELLQKEGLQVYERNGRVQGVICKGTKYRFTGLGITHEHLKQLNDMKKDKKIEEKEKTAEERYYQSQKDRTDAFRRMDNLPRDLREKINFEFLLLDERREIRHCMEVYKEHKLEKFEEMAKERNPDIFLNKLQLLSLQQELDQVHLDRNMFIDKNVIQNQSKSEVIMLGFTEFAKKEDFLAYMNNLVIINIEKLKDEREFNELKHGKDEHVQNAWSHLRDQELPLVGPNEKPYELAHFTELIKEFREYYDHRENGQKEQPATAVPETNHEAKNSTDKKELKPQPDEIQHNPEGKGRLLTTVQLNDVRQELSKLYADKNGLFLQITQRGLSDEKLSRDLDLIIQREAYLIRKEDELKQTLQKEQEQEKTEKTTLELPIEKGENQHTPNTDRTPEYEKQAESLPQMEIKVIDDQKLSDLITALSIGQDLADVKDEKNALLAEIENSDKGWNDPDLLRRAEDIINKEDEILRNGEEFFSSHGDEQKPYTDGQQAQSIEKQEETQLEHANEDISPDIDANPELFEIESEEGYDSQEIDEEDILSELEDMRNNDEDRDNFERDWDDDDIDR